VRDDSGVCKTLAATQRMFVHGYAVTTYASQGKTVDTVLLHSAGEEAKPAAVNRNQWYVGISRARKQALVFTNDLTALRTRIEHESSRAPAVSLAIDEAAQARLQAHEKKEHQRIMARYYKDLRAERSAQVSQGAPLHAQPPHPLSHEYQPPQPTQNRGMKI